MKIQRSCNNVLEVVMKYLQVPKSHRSKVARIQHSQGTEAGHHPLRYDHRRGHVNLGYNFTLASESASHEKDPPSEMFQKE